MKARIELLGPPLDVSDIVNVLSKSTSITVEVENNQTYLVSTIHSEEEISELRDNYKDELFVWNGIAKFLYGNHYTVSLGHAQVLHDDGRISAYISLETSEARSRAHGVLTNAAGANQPGKSIVELTESDQTLKDIFKMIEFEGYTWVNMYRIYEVLKETVGDLAIHGFGVTEAEIKLFTHTANNKKAIGFQARHGHSGFQPPAIPMTPKAAKNLINKMVNGYIQSLK